MHDADRAECRLGPAEGVQLPRRGQSADGPARGSLEKIVKIDNWYAQQFAYLVGKLKALSEGSGSVLDNSIALWANEQGNGQNHSHDHIPHVLAGGGGGSLRPDRSIDCGGRANSDLYVAILSMLGAEDVTTFGMPEVCKGALPGLS